MCCTFLPARLSNTLLYAGEAQWSDRYVHVLAYQNMASTSGPNAMILPLPATRLGPENAVDARPFRTFLEDLREATRRPRMPSFGPPGYSGPDALESAAVVFDVGSYTVVLSESPRAVLAALEQVPESKRPALNARMMDAFALYYPGWPVAVCCWSGDLRPEPLLWWYEPRFPEWLFAPALDAHDGNPPDLAATVDVDHYIAFGSATRPAGQAVRYRDDAGSFQPLLPPSVRGTQLFGRMSNGDFWSRADRLTGPAQRTTPGGKGAPILLDGWEGDAPPWADPAKAMFPATPLWPVPPEGSLVCARCGWLLEAQAKLCPRCGSFTAIAPR